MPVADRIAARTPAGNEWDCWEWSGTKTLGGYGQIQVDGRREYVHRIVVDAQPGEVVRHLCDNPPCVNPNHLLRGTTRDNIQDAIDRNRADPWGWRKRLGQPPERTHSLAGRKRDERGRLI